MTRKHLKAFTIVVFTLTALGIGVLSLLPKDFFSQKESDVRQTRVVIPQNAGSGGEFRGESQNLAGESSARVAFSENEGIISIIARDFDGDSLEEQIIAYRNLREMDTPILITYVDSGESGIFSRTWTAPTAATRPNSLVLYSEDLIGDGGICVLVSGMNAAGEQTLTVFRKNSIGGTIFQTSSEEFSKIAEFIIEGSIVVQEVQRSLDYQQGVRGQSLSISTFGRDYESANILDQIETTYTYNTINGLYEQSRLVKVPGRQIEQRRLNELLTAPGKFEEFIEGLWRYEMEDGRKQYVYFNPSREEVIFYVNNIEEIFTWQESNPTRYGLHIIGKNISLSKIRCTLNIELESLESVRLRVFQDAYLRTGPATVWDGSYKKVSLETMAALKRGQSYMNGSYGSADGGKIVFFRDGTYEVFGSREEGLHKGKYVFFWMGNYELLELRPSVQGISMITFRAERSEEESLSVTRVRIGTRGIQELEAPVALTKLRDALN